MADITDPSLIAAFFGVHTIGQANLLVLFTDESTGVPISWDWDFGDGSPHATTANPLHVYTQAGLHTVSLSIFDGIYSSTITREEYVSVDMVVDFSSNTQAGPADTAVSFIDHTFGDPTEWDWDFGDGSPHSTLKNPTHVYDHSDIFTVSLTASNSMTSATETKTHYITVTPSAEFYAEPRIGHSKILTQFVDLSKGPPLSWYWDFGDSSFSIEQNPEHLYSSPGEYTVTLITDGLLGSAKEIKTGYINVIGVGTPDIAPEPDTLLYLSDKVTASRNDVGISVKYKKLINNLIS